MLIAITGGIGCGKSTVLKLFNKLGATILSSDKIVHDLLDQEEIKGKLISLLGKEIIASDGSLDRKKIAEIIFNTEEKRQSIENLLHPFVFKEIKEAALKNPHKIVIAEVPLLFETGKTDIFDKIITVVSPEDIIKKRLMEKGFDISDFEKRHQCQLPIAEKIRKADFIIDNSGSLEETKKQVKEIWQTLTNANEQTDT